MIIARMDSIEDAIEMAQQLKKNGDYNLFRGQRKNWPLRSSFARLNDDQRKEALEKLSRFEQWIKNIGGLESIAKNADMVIAVAQHYGLPTNFIDFTRNPKTAGFFALADKKSDIDPNAHSCIICLNTKVLNDFLEKLLHKYKQSEHIQLSVPDLWRLEAQEGEFLFCPYENFDFIYDLDRIIFPQSHNDGNFQAQYYYPKRKSKLEIDLDQYFMVEKMTTNFKLIKSTMQNIHICTLSNNPTQCDPNLIYEDKLYRHKTWNNDDINLWDNIASEKYEHVTTNNSISIDTNLQTDSKMLGSNFKNKILQKLIEDKQLRHQLINFSITDKEEDDGNTYHLKEMKSITRLWDGLRRLPFTDDDIAIGLGNHLELMACHNTLGLQVDFKLVASACFGDSMEVEFGTSDGSYSKAYVSKQALLNCVRSDISQYLNIEYREQIEGNIVGLLQSCYDPRKLFNFQRLASLFATQICPSQVLMRGSTAIFYSPARLDSFGLP